MSSDTADDVLLLLQLVLTELWEISDEQPSRRYLLYP